MLQSLGVEHLFLMSTAVAWTAVVLLAAARRGRGFAIFAGILLGVHSLVSVALWPQFAARGLGVLVLAPQLAAFMHFGSLTFPRLRAWPFRMLVSWPGLWWAGATVLALPWAVVSALGVTPFGWWLPYAIALVGLAQSLRNRDAIVDLVLDREPIDGLARHHHGSARSDRPLRIVQITDPHLGPFMSVERLRGIAERAVAADPDLVLLTGDYLTMESQATPGCLAAALAPLAALEGRVFACRGNHDLEAPAMVAAELAHVGARLLVDEATLVRTPAGHVQIVGMDFRWRDRAGHAQEIAARWPRVPNALRIVLLHDPGAFVHLPDGDGDLVLSGHTHGGQLGLVSLGMKWTAVSLLSKVPDHGFWARGRNRLYVHRASGHYGFPLRVGVPGEEGVLHVHDGPARFA
jgi:predicted MPP superfamily phosphohydrolase